MANKAIDELTLLTAPAGADVPAAKTDTDYRIRVGEANGIATLGSDGRVPNAQLPSTATTGPVWGNITGTLSAQTDLNSALAGKANTSHTHTAGDITSGLMGAARLGVGTADNTTFLRGDGVWATGTPSDMRLKTDIKPIVYSALDLLQPVAYEWVLSGRKAHGFIAQEVEVAIPEAVVEDSLGILSIDSMAIIAHLVLAVKALKEEVNELRSSLRSAAGACSCCGDKGYVEGGS